MNITSISGKKVTLIGGAGFIGHNMALKLKSLGAEVSVIDGLNVNSLLYLNQTNVEIENRERYIKFINERTRLLNNNQIPLYVEDARDYHKLAHLIGTIKPDVVVLLAAVSHANRSNKDPFSTFDHSFRTLENALDCRKGLVDHFIYFSSSMVYGDFKEDSVSEDAICNPIGIYGSLKLGGEHLVKAYKQVFGLDYTIIRPSALYGERCVSRRVGQIFVENALDGKEIVIQGDGSDRLDFTYIDDLIGGVINIIENKNSRNEIFNITYGSSRSLIEMSEIIRQHFGNVKISSKQRSNLMPERGTLNVEKAKSLIGYNPSHPLEIGYVNYINWYKEYFSKPENR
jgi:nucleoside-diphosphate-sugar epimerase